MRNPLRPLTCVSVPGLNDAYPHPTSHPFQVCGLGAEAHLKTCFKHFIFFTTVRGGLGHAFPWQMLKPPTRRVQRCCAGSTLQLQQLSLSYTYFGRPLNHIRTPCLARSPDVTCRGSTALRATWALDQLPDTPSAPIIQRRLCVDPFLSPSDVLP